MVRQITDFTFVFRSSSFSSSVLSLRLRFFVVEVVVEEAEEVEGVAEVVAVSGVELSFALAGSGVGGGMLSVRSTRAGTAASSAMVDSQLTNRLSQRCPLVLPAGSPCPIRSGEECDVLYST